MDINAISSASSAAQNRSVGASGSSAPLSAGTRASLEALGVDTANIKTEAQGQEALRVAKVKATKKPHTTTSSEGSLKAEAKALATKLGASIPSDGKMEDILNNIKAKIDELIATAGKDPTKLSKIAEYQSQYTNLAKEFSNIQSSQSQLSASMNNMAMMNKIYLNLT